MIRTVQITDRAERDLRRMDRGDVQRVLARLRLFAETGEADMRKLQGVSPEDMETAGGGLATALILEW